MSKETYVYVKRGQRNSETETFIYRITYTAKETYLCSKRGLFLWQKRPIYVVKETYLCGKRDLFVWQKRPIYMAKETYVCIKRDLLIWQKRPIYVAKKTYFYDKRDLLIWQKRPVPCQRTRATARAVCPAAVRAHASTSSSRSKRIRSSLPVSHA